MSDQIAGNAPLIGLRAIKELNEGLEPETFYHSAHLLWLIEWLNKLDHGAPDARMLQTLILRSPSYLGLRAISIMIIDKNDHANNYCSHGYPNDAMKLQNIYTTIEEKLPSVDAMLTGKAVFLNSRKELESYSSYLRAWISYIPWMNSLMAFPLTSQERLSGSIVWSFDNNHVMNDFGRQLFTSLSLIVQSMMFEEFQVDGKTTDQKNMNNLMNSTDLKESVNLQNKFHMSDRQLLIAKMIADGFTNREISKTLNFSDSTARYETIKIYERLQVKNRAQAAALIRSLISKQSP